MITTERLEADIVKLTALGAMRPCPVCGKVGLCGKDEAGNGLIHVSFGTPKEESK